MRHLIKAWFLDSGFDKKSATILASSSHYGKYIVEDHFIDTAARRIRKAYKNKAKDTPSRIIIGEIEISNVRGKGWSLKVLIDFHARRIEKLVAEELK